MFCISTNNIQALTSYDSALRKYEDTKPKRGSGIVPLGPRHKNNMQLVKGTDYIAAQLHQTECVRWFQDGRVQVRCGRWATQSTSAFIHAVSPFRCFISNNHLWVHNVPMADSDVGLMFAPSSEEDQIRGWDGGRWKCLNPPSCYVRKLNKATTKTIRNTVVARALREYLKSMNALGAFTTQPTNGAQPYKAVNLMSHLLREPNTEPSLDVLAHIGEAMKGTVENELLYKAAVQAGLTTDEELYDRVPVTPSPRVRGLRCV